MVSIPWDVVEDLLCRLPVKPFKRFRCVAKSWRSLIDSERFIKLHLKRSAETMSHRHLIVHCGKDVFSVDLDNCDPANVKASVIKPPFPNGVDAISCSGNIMYVLSGQDLILWNPFTTECRKLPKIGDDDFPVHVGCYRVLVFGFAWDSVNDDYKVVRVLEHTDMFLQTWVASRAHMYVLKSNSWRQTVNFNYSVANWQAEVDGAFHTLIDDVTPAKIMAFSFESERHYELKLPSLGDTGKSKVLRMRLHKLGGCLSMSYTNELGIAIWVMKEYGVRNSWTKLLSIPMKLTKADVNNSIKPLVYTKDGHKVLLLHGFKTFFWQDLRNQTIDSVLVKDLPLMIENVETCCENLVSYEANKPANRCVIRIRKRTRRNSVRKGMVSYLWGLSWCSDGRKKDSNERLGNKIELKFAIVHAFCVEDAGMRDETWTACYQAVCHGIFVLRIFYVVIKAA